MSNDFFLNCDWGMSRFRLRLVRVADGVVFDESHSDEGVASVNCPTGANGSTKPFSFFLQGQN